MPKRVLATDYYLSPSGNDGNSGTFTSPWLTFNKAIPNLKPGETLYVRGGTYYQNGYHWIAPTGLANQPITIKAYGQEKPIFDGRNQNSDLLVIKNSVAYIIIDGLTIQNYGHPDWGGGAIFTQGGAHHITIRNCTFLNNGLIQQAHHIYIGAPGDNIIVHNNFFKNETRAGGGVHLWGKGSTFSKTNIYIYNNIFINDYWGVVAGDGVQNLHIYNNTFYNNASNINFEWDGQDGKLGVKDVYIKNNISYSGSGIGMIVGSFNFNNNINSDYNLWYGTTSPIRWGGNDYSINQFRDNTTNEDHGLQANPLFISASAFNFHLQSSSPAIDTGVNLHSQGVSQDFDGNSRPQSGPFDIGAYEYQSGGLVPSSTPSSPTKTPAPANKTPTPTPPACFLASSGDFNCDNLINESDLNTLLGKWMTNEKDITGDSIVNESDLNKLLGNWKAI